jgi:flavin-dependent dehydrogenase
MTNNSVSKVLIIGAGPSGSIAGALLQNKGYDEQNPYVKNARARFDTLAELCR